MLVALTLVCLTIQTKQHLFVLLGFLDELGEIFGGVADPHEKLTVKFLGSVSQSNVNEATEISEVRIASLILDGA